MNKYYQWTEWKQIQESKGLVFQWHELEERYIIWGYDNSEKHQTVIWKTILPWSVLQTYSQEQAEADLEDFENNFKSNGNKPLSGPKDEDGSVLSRVKVTKSGWHLQLGTIEFATSDKSLLFEKKKDGSNTGFAIVKTYDSNGAETQVPAEAVKTILSWEPTHDYEIIGAMFYQLVKPTEDIRMWATGVPDVPAAYGGSKEFIGGGINLRYIPLESVLRIDGRASKTLKYDANYHSNKMQIIIVHPLGHVHKMMTVFEIYKP